MSVCKGLYYCTALLPFDVLFYTSRYPPGLSVSYRDFECEEALSMWCKLSPEVSSKT